MRVRLLDAVGKPQELLRIPGLAQELRHAVRRDVSHPSPPTLGAPGAGLGQSRLAGRRRRRRIARVTNGQVRLKPNQRPWTSFDW